MLPAASVSGRFLAHPEAHCLAVGRPGRDQVADYARRRGMRLHDAGTGSERSGPNLEDRSPSEVPMTGKERPGRAPCTIIRGK